MAEETLKKNYYLEYLQKKKAKIRSFYDQEAQRYAEYWIPKNYYYYDQIKKLLSKIVPPGKKVLDVGCGTGHILASLNPSYGLGIDFSSAMIQEASKRYPHLDFQVLDAEEAGNSIKKTFDYIIAANSLTEATDIRRWLKSLYKVMTPESRLIIITYNYLWEPILEFGALLGIRPRSPAENWFSPHDLHNLLTSTDFDIINEGYRTILPKRVPLFSLIFNNVLVRLPFFQILGVTYYIVARPLIPFKNPETMTVSIVVPCKNEEDNIDQLIERIPDIGGGTEIIFVDDKSTDRTAQKIQEQIKAHPNKKIKFVEGPGEGKGAACRAGFAVAENDVFMILDADMTVMPEVLPEFFEMIVSGKGEFINGSRLLYPMEEQAMKIANIFGNKMFALLFTFLLGQPIKDTLCGTKVILKRDYYKLIEARSYFGNIDRWGDYDWIFGAALYNLKIVELPVHYVSRKAGKTKMTNRLYNAWIMLKMCWVAFKKIKLA